MFEKGRRESNTCNTCFSSAGFIGHDAPQFDDITMLAFRYNGKQ